MDYGSGVRNALGLAPGKKVSYLVIGIWSRGPFKGPSVTWPVGPLSAWSIGVVTVVHIAQHAYFEGNPTHQWCPFLSLVQYMCSLIVVFLCIFLFIVLALIFIIHCSTFEGLRPTRWPPKYGTCEKARMQAIVFITF